MKKEPQPKQAYLIIAHKCDLTFLTLIKMLDEEYNHIFIHMDAKNKGYDGQKTENLVSKAKVFHTPRTKVVWGEKSLVNAELMLLETATSTGQYQHYHLLSGQDLPIQTQSTIRQFFESHPDAEFVSVSNPTFKYPERVHYRWFLQAYVGKQHWNPLRLIRNIILFSQKILNLKTNKSISFQKGAQWFSIRILWRGMLLKNRSG